MKEEMEFGEVKGDIFTFLEPLKLVSRSLLIFWIVEAQFHGIPIWQLVIFFLSINTLSA